MNLLANRDPFQILLQRDVLFDTTRYLSIDALYHTYNLLAIKSNHEPLRRRRFVSLLKKNLQYKVQVGAVLFTYNKGSIIYRLSLENPEIAFAYKVRKLPHKLLLFVYLAFSCYSLKKVVIRLRGFLFLPLVWLTRARKPLTFSTKTASYVCFALIITCACIKDNCLGTSLTYQALPPNKGHNPSVSTFTKHLRLDKTIQVRTPLQTERFVEKFSSSIDRSCCIVSMRENPLYEENSGEESYS